MTFNILLYGATGHSGEMIAARAAQDGLADNVIVAGRDGAKLAKVAAQHGMRSRCFGLEDPREVVRSLMDVDLVVNAAGPFKFTADRLAAAAIEAPCNYLDINGEIDVYMKTDDLARKAARQGVAIVSSAGHTGAGSCLMLHRALRTLEHKFQETGLKDEALEAAKQRLGAIRIAMCLPAEYSQGSMITALRLVREQILTIRRGQARDSAGKPIKALVKWHEPVGRLDRPFDFGAQKGASGSARVATAANLVDTLIAMHVVKRSHWGVDSIESYLQMDVPARATYQVASTLSPLAVLPLVETEARMWARFLTPRQSAGPDNDKQIIVLEIENDQYERVIDWRLSVPSAYRFTAQLAVELAKGLTGGKRLKGWVTPNEVLSDDHGFWAAVKDCDLAQRIGRERH